MNIPFIIKEHDDGAFIYYAVRNFFGVNSANMEEYSELELTYCDSFLLSQKIGVSRKDIRQILTTRYKAKLSSFNDICFDTVADAQNAIDNFFTPMMLSLTLRNKM